MTIDKRAIDSAQQDAEAFKLTRVLERRAFIRQLINDPMTQAFSPEIARWLLDSLEEETRARERDRQERYSRAQQKADATLDEAQGLRKLSLATSEHHGYLHTCKSSDDGSVRTVWTPKQYELKRDLFPGCDQAADVFDCQPCYLNRAPAERPKGKVIRQLSRMVSRQAEAIVAIDSAINGATQWAETDSDAYEQLSYAVEKWQEQHATLIEECKP